MKKIYLTVLFALAGLVSVQAQGKYFSRDAHIKFFSSTPIEDIEADNHKVTAVLDEETGKLEFSALMKSFEFEKALMEEHFNENYVESNEYPKAVFKGNVADYKMGAYGNKTEVVAKGMLSMHGVEREVEVPGTLHKTADGYAISAKFMVVPEDYDIEIPNTVRDNIAKQVEVTVDANLVPLKK